MKTAPRFSKETLAFLTRLKRNNRREWFNARRDEYEAVVRQPMFAIIDRLAVDMRGIAPDGVWIGGGMYAPETPQLHKVREQIAENLRHFRSIVEAPAFRRSLDGGLDGERLTRVPRGFPKDHEAAEYLRYRQFLAGKEFPARFATDAKFYSGMLDVYRKIAPLVRFLNEALRA